jgi:acyl-CoA synthetase (NDP forming)/GNAT superfamily N-acetyltransferase
MTLTATLAPSAADALLVTGAVVAVRPTQPLDRGELVALYDRCTSESRRMRFFTVSPMSERQDIERLLRAPSHDHLGAVAVERGVILAAGCIEATHDGDTAEFAMIVDDSRHGEGLGTLLLEYLVSAARQAGYRRLCADVLGENTSMLKLVGALGAVVGQSSGYGVVTVEFGLDEAPELLAHIDDREEVAEYASIRRLLAPRGVAVIGAGHDEDGIGHRILRNLQISGFTGQLSAVNRSGDTSLGVPTVTAVRDLDPVPDLVVIAVPADAVLDVIDDCASIGVYGAVIISDGFAELGGDGEIRQSELLTRARQAGMRLIGPNCLGVLNLDPAVRLNATFADSSPIPGPVALASQSGGVGLALIDYLTHRGIGLSTFVSMGNKADISCNDLLMFWNLDADTKVCALYLESFGNARKFARLARRVGRHKPIVAITAGGSSAGARGVMSHTAAAATPDATIDALFSQAGVIRARSLSEMLDIVGLLARAPIPAGRRVAVVTNGGGPGALAADACAAAHLVLPALSATTQRTVAALLPLHAAVANPIDTTAGAAPTALADVARVVIASGEVDSVIVVHASVKASDADLVAISLQEVACDASQHPVLGVFIGRTDPPVSNLPAIAPTLATFTFPESAANALTAAVGYAEWKARPPVRPPTLTGTRRRSTHRIVRGFLDAHPDGGWLDTDLACEFAESYGIEVVRTIRVTSRDEAVAAAAGLGVPVALKSGAGSLLHRTEVGAVALDLRDAEAVADAFDRLRSRLDPATPLVVQPMVGKGVETAMGIVQDPSVGPVVMIALGGVATELLADRRLCLPPLDRATVAQQIRLLRSAPLLFGYRGEPQVDVRALEDTVLRVSQLATEVAEVADLDLNPVIVSEHGAVAVDVKIRLRPVATGGPSLRRLLSER